MMEVRTNDNEITKIPDSLMSRCLLFQNFLSLKDLHKKSSELITIKINISQKHLSYIVVANEIIDEEYVIRKFDTIKIDRIEYKSKPVIDLVINEHILKKLTNTI